MLEFFLIVKKHENKVLIVLLQQIVTHKLES